MSSAGRLHRGTYRVARAGVYTLGVLLGLSLLVVGTVVLIGVLKGTWHWMIHIESTISYMAVFVQWLLVALVPCTAVFLYGRVRWEVAP